MLIFITDIVIVLISVLLALKIRFGTIYNSVLNQNTTIIFAILSVLFLAYLNNLYVRYVYVSKLKLFFKIIKLWIAVLLLYIAVAFITRYNFLISSRAFIILYHAFLLSFLLVFKLTVIPQLLALFFKKKVPCKFDGPKKYLEDIDTFFAENPQLGFVRIRSEEEKPKEVFLLSETDDFGELYDLMREYLNTGYTLHVASKLFNELNLNWEWAYINGLPIYTFFQKNNVLLRGVLRRLIDFIGSVLSIVLLSPFFLIISLAIKLDSRGPVIYKQKRCGANGKPFTLYKFRSMINSDDRDRKRELEYKRYLEQKTSKGKVLDRNEITFIGSILRRTSLDELPQFLNVLKGDMSIVGPRPPIPYEVKYYKGWHRDRLLVKPGLTGLWQVYGRGNMPCDSSIFLDLMYINNRSLSLDLKIMLRTIPVVLLGKGAY